MQPILPRPKKNGQIKATHLGPTLIQPKMGNNTMKAATATKMIVPIIANNSNGGFGAAIAPMASTSSNGIHGFECVPIAQSPSQVKYIKDTKFLGTKTSSHWTGRE
jgi:hypothetical protein